LSLKETNILTGTKSWGSVK